MPPSLSLFALQVMEPQPTWRVEVLSAAARVSPTQTSSSTSCRRRSSTTGGLHPKSKRIRCVFVTLLVCVICCLLGMLSLQNWHLFFTSNFIQCCNLTLTPHEALTDGLVHKRGTTTEATKVAKLHCDCQIKRTL